MPKKNPKLLEYVRRQEYKRRLEAHEVWGHVDGRFYGIVKIFYTIAFVLAQVVNIAYLAISANRYVSEKELLDNPGQTRNAIIIVALGIILLIAAYVLLAKRRPFGYLVCTLAPSVLLCFHYYNEMSGAIAENGWQNYILKHALWYIILTALALVMMAIQLNENRKENKEYAAVEAKLYKRMAKNSDAPISDEEWEELLCKYGDDNDAERTERSDETEE